MSENPPNAKAKCHKVVIKQAGPYLETVVQPHCDPVAASGRIEDCVCDSYAVRDALSTLLRVGASLVTTGMSCEISEWDLPKTTTLKTKRKIVEEAEKWNDVNRRRSIELKNAFDVLSRHFR